MLPTHDNSRQIEKANTMEVYFQQFLLWLDMSRASAKTYRTGIKSFLFWLYSNNIKQPQRQDLINYRNELEASGKSAATVATYLAGLRAFFAWLEENRLYVNITARVKAPKIGKEPKKDALTGSQLKNVIKSADGAGLQALRDKAIITLISSCGLRTIEVSRANIDDIRTKNGKDVIFIQGKGHSEKDAFIPLPASAKRAIDAYLQARGKTWKNAPLFASASNNSTGKPLTTRSISQICKNALMKAGYISSRLTAHSLRHTVATEALKNGASAHEVQLYLRHSNINTTMIYAHEIEQAENVCASIMESILS